MSEKYRIRDNDKPHFITITTVGWIDLFTRLNHKRVIIDSLNYCVKNKGLMIFAWVLMSNHLHMICQAEEGYHLSDIMRDFKTFTSKRLIQQIIEDTESRKEWMLDFFKNSCSHLKRNQEYKVWQDGYHPEEIYRGPFLYEKLDYVHNNPVKQMIVQNPWEYMFSSAMDYAGLEGLVTVFILDHKPLIYS